MFDNSLAARQELCKILLSSVVYTDLKYKKMYKIARDFLYKLYFYVL